MRASERTYETLREEILDGTLAAGTVLAEVEQAERLGVSRTPVREALARLGSDGLVAAQSARALVVAELSGGSIADLYELREALEEQAARLAARRGEPERFTALAERFRAAGELVDAGETGLAEYYAVIADFDRAIDEAAGNSHLSAALRSVRLHSTRIRRIARHDPERLRAAAGEHLLIVEAIIARDQSLAAHATHVHLHMSLRHALASIEARRVA
ncbi:GntR family transcriptional regulator [Agromyces aureus]|uniref:GntR family transcriptional regulator n=1 Tax=Agromyces aureus TaxID=453304 RepID=A0A191WBF9_9MICO|nr:GntR family transcriptional regulator [Agromyces aureus]ANJ25533.1 GntR family transcriptional regulator [Agromyces aureus]